MTSGVTPLRRARGCGRQGLFIIDSGTVVMFLGLACTAQDPVRVGFQAQGLILKLNYNGFYLGSGPGWLKNGEGYNIVVRIVCIHMRWVIQGPQ